MTGKCEAVWAAVEQLPSGADFEALALLEKIDALSGIDTRALQGRLEHAADGLFATELDRNRVERALRDRPIPEGCPLQVDEAEQYIEQAEAVEREAIALVRGRAGRRCKCFSGRRCEACWNRERRRRSSPRFWRPVIPRPWRPSWPLGFRPARTVPSCWRNTSRRFRSSLFD